MMYLWVLIVATHKVIGSFDLLIRLLKSAEFLKGTIPENSNIFETNRNTNISSLLKVVSHKVVRIKTYYNLLLTTHLLWQHMQSCDLLIFRSCDNQRTELLKGQSQKIQIFLKLIQRQIYLHFQMPYGN